MAITSTSQNSTKRIASKRTDDVRDFSKLLAPKDATEKEKIWSFLNLNGDDRISVDEFFFGCFGFKSSENGFFTRKEFNEFVAKTGYIFSYEQAEVWKNDRLQRNNQKSERADGATDYVRYEDVLVQALKQYDFSNVTSNDDLFLNRQQIEEIFSNKPSFSTSIPTKTTSFEDIDTDKDGKLENYIKLYVSNGSYYGAPRELHEMVVNLFGGHYALNRSQFDLRMQRAGLSHLVSFDDVDGIAEIAQPEGGVTGKKNNIVTAPELTIALAKKLNLTSDDLITAEDWALLQPKQMTDKSQKLPKAGNSFVTDQARSNDLKTIITNIWKWFLKR